MRLALVEPLAAKEDRQSKFSRARMPPQERRVRIGEKPATDAEGRIFYTFSIDARHGFLDDDAGWRLSAHTGCVYPEDRQVFVKVGEAVRPAAFLLGKKLKPAAATTCTPAPGALAAR